MIIILISDNFSSRHNSEENKKECYIELQRTFKGTVMGARFDDDINVKAFVIYLTNGYKYVNPYFLRSLNGEIKSGDSIYKEIGSFRFIIYKKGISIPYVHEDTVDCEKL